MKKYIISLIAGIGLSCFGGTITTSQVVQPANTTNITTMLGGSCTLLSASIASGNAVGSANIVDNYTNLITQTFGAYSNLTYSATNWITVWTNYYGATNTVTNKALLTTTNSVAAATVALPVVLSLVANTNTTVQYTGMNQRFIDGIVVTNTSAAAVTVTVTYSQ